MENENINLNETPAFAKPVLAAVPDHGMCKEANCKNKATRDYNGYEYWVCKYHYDKLSDYFDEEYD